MRYLPHTEQEISEMLAVTGHTHLDDLFSHIPDNCRFQDEVDLPGPLTEWALSETFQGLAKRNAAASARAVLLGGGSYSHYIPEIVPSLIKRSEFLTAYTPYQPEISQGRLEAILNFQTMVTEPNRHEDG